MRFATLSFSVLLLGALACGDDPKRPLGATCTSHAECESGVCGGGVCLDPEGDEDLDGLINRIEASLSTNPVVADTDGDGETDNAEVGTPGAATDSDGDGKIDAVESATADVDADCIPDEQDARDAFSDLPSEGFPNACGNGRPFPDDGGGDGGDDPMCESLKTHLGGTCAAALGVALADCFDPVGCITPETNPDGNSRVVWENGAYLEQEPTTEVIRFYSSRAQLCAEGELVEDSETQSIFTYRASGQSWTITVASDGDGSADIRCADGTVVHVTAEGSAAVSACQGTSYKICDGVIPGQCRSAADCEGGLTCCIVNDNGYCLAAGSCPQ